MVRAGHVPGAAVMRQAGSASGNSHSDGSISEGPSGAVSGRSRLRELSREGRSASVEGRWASRCRSWPQPQGGLAEGRGGRAGHGVAARGPGPRCLSEVDASRGSDTARPGPAVRVPEARGLSSSDRDRPALWRDLAAASADGSCGVSQVEVLRKVG